MADLEISETNEELATLLATRLRIRRGTSLAEKLKVAGRLLPKRIRRDGAYLVATEERLQNPRLAKQQDPKAVKKAYDRVHAYLSGIDPKDRLKGQILGILAPLAFNLLILAALLITWARWQGFI